MCFNIFYFYSDETPLDLSKSIQMKKLLEVQPIRHKYKTVQRFEGPLIKVYIRFQHFYIISIRIQASNLVNGIAGRLEMRQCINHHIHYHVI